jgi:hypothetical protein
VFAEENAMAIHIQGDNAEAVAYALLLGIATREGRDIVEGVVKGDKPWLLSTYQECLRAVKLMPPSSEDLAREEAEKTTEAANTGQPEPQTKTAEARHPSKLEQSLDRLERQARGEA